MKRTPLYDTHVRLGGRMVEFGGWDMPVQYTSIVDEHRAVRTAGGLFDISHMGEVQVVGPEAAAFLNLHLTNDVQKLAAGQGQYSLMCNERGGVIDDLYVYRTGPADFLMIINAARIAEDLAWLCGHLPPFLEGRRAGGAVLEDRCDQTGAVAVQGPKVVEFIDGCVTGPATKGWPCEQPSQLKKNQLAAFQFQGASVWVARTGYTGEDGFELVAPAEAMLSLWDKLLIAGQPFGLKPAGLGARDTLRTEMCYPLYGHELNENTTPLEAGLGFFVSLSKGDFVGRSVLAKQKEQGVARKLVAFTLPEKSPPPPSTVSYLRG